MLWLESSLPDKSATIDPVSAVNLRRFGKNVLDQVIALLACPNNPDPFRLIHCR